MILTLAMIVLFVLLAIGTPVGFAMAGSGVLGLYLVLAGAIRFAIEFIRIDVRVRRSASSRYIRNPGNDVSMSSAMKSSRHSGSSVTCCRSWPSTNRDI